MNYRMLPQSTLHNKRYIGYQSSTSSHSNGTYTSSPSDFISAFYAVLRRWRSETAFCSDPDEITAHPSYKALVQHAPLVTDLIIDDLRISPSLLVWVLDDAYPDRPYPEDAIGDIVQMSNAWISWAERRGQNA